MALTRSASASSSASFLATSSADPLSLRFRREGRRYGRLHLCSLLSLGLLHRSLLRGVLGRGSLERGAKVGVLLRTDPSNALRLSSASRAAVSSSAFALASRSATIAVIRRCVSSACCGSRRRTPRSAPCAWRRTCPCARAKVLHHRNLRAGEHGRDGGTLRLGRTGGDLGRLRGILRAAFNSANAAASARRFSSTTAYESASKRRVSSSRSESSEA